MCVAFVNPGHTTCHLSGASIFTKTGHVRNDAAVTVEGALGDLGVLLKAQRGEALTAGGTEWLAAFRCIYGGKPNRYLFVVARPTASRFKGVAVCDANDEAKNRSDQDLPQ